MPDAVVPRVVLDTCVLFASVVRDILLRCAEMGLIQPVWSAKILIEVRRALVRSAACSADQADRMIRAMRAAFPAAAIRVPRRTIAAMRNDHRDRHVAVAAVAAGASAVITFNLRHFKPAPPGVAVLTPDILLCLAFGDSPDIVVGAVAAARSALPTLRG